MVLNPVPIHPWWAKCASNITIRLSLAVWPDVAIIENFCYKFSCKNGSNFWERICFCEKLNFLNKTAVATFWTTFGENWATFYSNIWWSHWSQGTRDPIAVFVQLAAKFSWAKVSCALRGIDFKTTPFSTYIWLHNKLSSGVKDLPSYNDC